MKEQPTVTGGEDRWEAVVGMALLFLAAAILFSVNIGSYALWPADEPRFGQVSREMMASGNYLSPTINGESYLDKPPLLFWAIAAVSHLAGDVTEWSARLPSVLAALVTLALTYLLALRLFGHRVALWSVIVLATSLGFWWQARTVQVDMLLTMLMTAALYGLWRWDESRKAKWLVLLYGVVAAGMLAKGLPVLLFPLLFIFVFYWKQPASRKQTHWAPGAMAAILVTAIWYVPARLGATTASADVVPNGITESLYRDIIGGFLSAVSNAQPPWYTVETLLFDCFPWILFLPWILVYAWRNRHANRMMWFLMCWIVPALLFFTLSISNRAIYILPLFPAMAIIIACGLVYFDQSATIRWRNRIAALWGCLMLALGGALTILSAVSLSLSGPPTALALKQPALVLVTGVVLLLLGIYALERGWRSRTQLIHRIVAGQMAIFLFMSALVLLPELDAHSSAKNITAPIRLLAEAGREMDVYSAGGSGEEYIFYARHSLEPLHSGLLGAEETAGQQRRARELMTAALENIPIENIENITEKERESLRNAFDRERASANLQDVEAEVLEVFSTIVTRFSTPEPAFMFIPAPYWLWLQALWTSPVDYHVIRHERVCGRHVMLLANPAGYALYETRTGGTAPLS